MVEKVLCCARFVVSALIEEEMCSDDPWDEKRREACLPLEFALVGRARVHDCKCLGWIAIEIQREKFFDIFGNNLKIMPIRPTEITDCSTAIKTFDLTPYL